MRATRILSNLHTISRIDKVQTSLDELCEEREDGLTRAPDGYRPRQSQNSLSHGGPLLDTRISQPRECHPYEVHQPLFSFGGSFAFEEMARSLGQAQRNSIAYPLTTAMLAPLSQSTGLSPRQTIMRAGLRFDARPRRPSDLIPSALLVPSSARSDDGGGLSESYYHQKFSSRPKNISAQTSPSLSHALPLRLRQQLRDHQLDDDEGESRSLMGESPALGSEISFGSETFSLHPFPSDCRKPPSTTYPSISSAGEWVQQRPVTAEHQASASMRAGNFEPHAFAGGLLPPGVNASGQRALKSSFNRSLSLPRPVSGPFERSNREHTTRHSEPSSPGAAKRCFEGLSQDDNRAAQFQQQHADHPFE